MNSTSERIAPGDPASPPAFTIRALQPSEFARWDDFVRQSPQGTLFHSTLWLEAARAPFRLYGYFRGADLRGGFAIGDSGGRAAQSPHSALTAYLGILFPKPDAKYVTTLSTNKEISAAFASFLKSDFDWVQVRFPPEVVDLQPFLWAGWQGYVRYTYRLAVHDLDAVLDNMDGARRRNLRTAEKRGITVENEAPFAHVMALCEKSFHRQGLTATFRDAAVNFEAALRKGDRCRGFLARDRGGRPLGAVWIVWDEKRAYYLIGGYDAAANSSDAVALAMWRAIQFTAETLNLPEFDFEGSMIPAVERFFRKFGGRLLPTYAVTYQKPVSLTRRIFRKLARLAGGQR